MHLTAEDKILLLSIKIHLNESEIEQLDSLIPEVRKWDYFIENIIERGLAPLFYKKISLLTNKAKIPDFVLRKLRKTYYTTLKRSIYQYDEFKKIISEFNKADIPVIALKGIYLSESLYRDLGLRQMSDIDLMIHERDNKEGLDALDRLGFNSFDGEESEIGGQTDLMHYKTRVNDKDIYVELHIKIHQDFEKFHIPVENLWENSVNVSLNSTPVRSLNLIDTLIHLIIHLDKHFRYGHIQFSSVSDIVNILALKQSEIDWTAFVDSCKKYYCLDLGCKYLILFSKYINIQVPDIIVKQNKKISVKEEKRFLRYLRGEKFYDKTHVFEHITLLNELPSQNSKLFYLIKILFPPKSFIIEKYNISNQLLIPFYYLYRYLVGIKGFVSVMLHKF